jgi:predicted dehydrogenase
VNKIKVIVVGYGYWGPNLVRNIQLNSDFELICVVDADQNRAQAAEIAHQIPTFNSISELGDLSQIDLAVIATRPSSHLSMVEFFAKNKINILLTKPCGASRKDAEKMQALSEKFQVMIFCDFTYRFSPYIEFLLLDERAAEIINEMQEYVSYRTSLGIFQSDVDVIADLAVHDIYILNLLRGAIPKYVNAFSIGLTVPKHPHSAFISLRWEDGFSAALHVSWKSPKKTRLISIVSDSQAIIIEELNKSAPLQLVKIAPNFSQSSNIDSDLKKSRNESYSIGDVVLPSIVQTESLKNEFAALASEIRTRSGVFPTVDQAIEVWLVVEAIMKSIETEGSTTYV